MDVSLLAPNGVGSVYTDRIIFVADGEVAVDSAFALALLSAGFVVKPTEQETINMAKLLTQIAGVLTEQSTTTTSAGVGSAGLVVNLDAGGKLDSSVLPIGIARQSITAVAAEALAAGAFVYFDGSGQVRNAIATANATEAVGFVTAAVSAGANAIVYLDETNTALAGLTPGAAYFLSDSAAGTAAATAPTITGHIVQRVGRAVSATEIDFRPAPSIVLA